MSETPDEAQAREKEAWEKSLTAGSLPTWWKPDGEAPTAEHPAPAPPPPNQQPTAAQPPAPTPSAPPPPAPAPPLIAAAPPDWEGSRTAGSLPTWWRPGDPMPQSHPGAAIPTPPVQAAIPPPPVQAAAPSVPPPAAPVAPPAPQGASPAPLAPDQANTVRLDRPAFEASAPSAPAPPSTPGERDQQTMVMGTFKAPRTASLKVSSGPDAGMSWPIDSSPIYIGRATDNGIVVNDPATSRRHARFEKRGEDFLVVDLGSANGTLVDGRRVVEQVLSGGTVISMGQNLIEVTIS